MHWADLKLRLRALLTRARAEGELDDELEFHLAMEARKLRASGLSEADALLQARRRFGGFQRAREECRDARGIRWIETFWQDVRFALRGLRRAPWFGVSVAATIALGLGLNTALFTVFNAYVLRPLEVRDPYSLYQFGWATRTGGGFITHGDVRRVRSRHASFSEVLAYEPVFAKSAGRDLFGNRVSANYFAMLGVGMAMGPGFERESAPGQPFTVVLSHNGWTAKFAADPNILGKTVPMLGAVYEVVGVARAAFNGIGQAPVDFWIPEQEGGAEDTGRLSMVGRLAPGVSMEQARAILLVEARQLTEELPEPRRVTAILLRSNATTMPLMPETIALFLPVAGAFALVLLMACANVASMMLGRSLARQREMGIRLSLGAGRMRLVHQLAVEGLVLAVPAAALGFAISVGTVHAVEALLHSTLPPTIGRLIRFVDLSPDVRVFLFLLSAALAATLMFALLPAWQVTRISVAAATRGQLADGGRPSRMRQGLVVLQVTASALLLICAGVLVRASLQLANRDTGFAASGVISIALQGAAPAVLLDSVRALPLVESAAVSWYGPLVGGARGISAAAGAGHPEWTRATYNFVAPEYFGVLRIPITRGRNFTAAEASGAAAVAVVSEGAARRLWPGRDPLGQLLQVATTGQWVDPGNRLPKFGLAEVVGIVPDVMSMVMEGKEPTSLYFPTIAGAEGNDTMLVRLRGDTVAANRALDAFLETKASAVRRSFSLAELFAVQLYPFQVSAFISGLLGGLALLFTLSGMYGLLSYLVAQRTREIGIRMALGATVADVVRMVVTQSMRLALAGVILGALLALVVSRWLASFIENAAAFDLLAYAEGPAAVFLAALVAAVFPSRKAASIEPSTTLRLD